MAPTWGFLGALGRFFRQLFVCLFVLFNLTQIKDALDSSDLSSSGPLFLCEETVHT